MGESTFSYISVQGRKIKSRHGKIVQKIEFFTKLLVGGVYSGNMDALSSSLAIKAMWQGDFTCHQSIFGPE